MGTPYLAWALSMLGDASTVDLASGAEATVRAGAMAVVADEAPKPAMEYSLTTMSGIRIASEQTTFILRYRPRTYYQIPNIADTRRPLYLHQADGTYSTSLSPRLTLSWNGNLSVGDVTYASLARTFDEGTTAAAAARLPLLFFSSSANASYATGRLNTVSLGANVGYRSVLNTLLDKEDVQIPEALNVGVTATDTMTLTRRDRLGVTVGATYSQIESTAQRQVGDAMFGTAFATWNHAHSQRSDSALSAGIGASRNVEVGPTSLFPVATATHTNRFRWWGTAFTSSVTGGARGFVDPILATMRPQAFLAWGLTGQHGRSFSTQTRFSAFTSLTGDPLEPPQYETNISSEVSGNYALRPGLSLRAGVAWQVRAPHWEQFEALELQSQPTAFVSLRGAFGSDRLQGSWL